jgi:CheY-like chemotaxis protein
MVLVLLGCLLLARSDTAWAQDEAPAKPAKKAAAAKAKPAIAAPAKPPKAKPDKTETKEKAAPPSKDELAPPDPAVEAILDAKPTAPSDVLKAAILMVGLKRPDLAKKYLAQLLAAKPDDAKWAALVDEFTSKQFLELVGKAELAPEAGEVTKAAFAATARRLEDPQRLTTLIQQLQDPSEETQAKAITGLLEAGTAAVFPLLNVLADPKQASQHPRVRQVLVGLRSAAREPLVAVLDAPDPPLVVQAIAMLAQMDARQSAVYLLAPLMSARSDPAVKQAARAALLQLLGLVPTADQAAALLVGRAEEFFAHRQMLAGAVEGHVDLWHWDAATKRPAKRTYAVDDAGRAMALRLAREAFRIRPDDPAIRRLYLATLLDEEAYRLGRDKLPAGATTAEAEAAHCEPAVLDDVLAYGLAHEHPALAAAAARVLGRDGTAAGLLDRGPTPAPLVMALRHGDRRLQLSALQAIVELKPQEAFSGSSYVPEALAFLVHSRAAHRVLVAAPNSAVAMQSVSPLIPLGYELDFVPTGREAIEHALASPDYEFAIIDAGIDRPTVEFVVQELRRDFRTADLPVLLLARETNLSHAEYVAKSNRLTMAFPRPHTPAALSWQVEQLMNLAGRDFVPAEVRKQQTLRALDLLGKWLAGPVKSCDLLRIQEPLLTALWAPPFALAAAPVVGCLGTPESQRALVDLASQTHQPLEVRQAAAKAFAANLKKSGILLTTAEIARQYDRYNQSEHLDPGTQAVLSAILDSLEDPMQTAKAKASPRDKRPSETKPPDRKS